MHPRHAHPHGTLSCTSAHTHFLFVHTHPPRQDENITSLACQAPTQQHAHTCSNVHAVLKKGQLWLEQGLTTRAVKYSPDTAVALAGKKRRLRLE
eukprot:3564780-Rhodomonas_salina.1